MGAPERITDSGEGLIILKPVIILSWPLSYNILEALKQMATRHGGHRDRLGLGRRSGGGQRQGKGAGGW